MALTTKGIQFSKTTALKKVLTSSRVHVEVPDPLVGAESDCGEGHLSLEPRHDSAVESPGKSKGSILIIRTGLLILLGERVSGFAHFQIL